MTSSSNYSLPHSSRRHDDVTIAMVYRNSIPVSAADGPTYSIL